MDCMEDGVPVYYMTWRKHLPKSKSTAGELAFRSHGASSPENPYGVTEIPGPNPSNEINIELLATESSSQLMLISSPQGFSEELIDTLKRASLATVKMPIPQPASGVKGPAHGIFNVCFDRLDEMLGYSTSTERNVIPITVRGAHYMW